MQVDIDELEALLNRVLATQQPFFTDFLGRLSRVESNETQTNNILADIRTSLALLAAQDLKGIIADIKRDVEQLKRQRFETEGAFKFANLAPKFIGYLAVIVVVIMAWANLKGKI